MYSLLPDVASANNSVKQQYINGHYCYAHKVGVMTNGNGIIRDIAFFDDEATSYITLRPSECVVFFPEDAHAPGIAQGVLRKAVIKVKI